MRLGVWMALLCPTLAFPLAACSGGYPLAPTRCDDWCDATKGGECEDWYAPASCVSMCEESNTDVEDCRAEFDASVSCFRHSPNAAKQQCVYDGQPHECQNEAQTLAICVANHYPAGNYGG